MKPTHFRVSRIAEARAIAREAFVYGFPLVECYRVLHSYFVDRAGPHFKAPWNELFHEATVFGPDSHPVASANPDTPCSFLGADLRTEPLVLSFPEVSDGRFTSAQLVDLYTFNFAYVGSRTTGTRAVKLLLAGPSWKGEPPPGVQEVVQAETDLVMVLYRTQLFGQDDVENLRQVQAGLQVQPLSVAQGKPPRLKNRKLDFVKPIGANEAGSSLEFFDVLNFVLRFCPTHASEKELMERFRRLGIGAGKSFDAQSLPTELRKAVEAGMTDAWREYSAVANQLATGELMAGDLYGSRRFLKGNHLYRMVGAVDGLHGSSREEGVSFNVPTDANGHKLDGAAHRYVLHFDPGQLPPVNAFWSLTMYQLPSRLLVQNPAERYLINSTMLPTMRRNLDGSLTLYVQHASPGAEHEMNWLPAPSGPFCLVLRLYWPKTEAFSGQWRPPPMKKQPSAAS